MVNLVWVNTMKIFLKAIKQLRFGLFHFLGLKLQYNTEQINQPAAALI